ncbi:MAG: tRNA preQ1(34) S-adenosylmethionine ribosyltransferase-isomerase QueA [Woeseia sp.]
MQLADFDFELPDDLVAKYPASERRASRLLEVDPRRTGNGLHDRGFAEFPDLLQDGDLLVFNDTRVIKARLLGRKSSGGRVELLIERLVTETAALAHIRASKKPRPGTIIELAGGCEGQVTGRDGELFCVDFDRPVLAFLEQFGEIPLPPYLEREADKGDEERYQTVYARTPGAVAAPTAGLHFDAAMLADIAARGIQQAFVTLHVGAGTFQSLRDADVDANRLHRERIVVGEDVCDKVRAARDSGGRVIAVGTTSVRVLEASSVDGVLTACEGETDLFIRPGYEFQQVDAMLTNFHLPQSSLLILVSAFAGRECMLRAYRHAVAERYRFFSYGDAMFISARGQTA